MYDNKLKSLNCELQIYTWSNSILGRVVVSIPGNCWFLNNQTPTMHIYQHSKADIQAAGGHAAQVTTIPIYEHSKADLQGRQFGCWRACSTNRRSDSLVRHSIFRWSLRSSFLYHAHAFKVETVGTSIQFVNGIDHHVLSKKFIFHNQWICIHLWHGVQSKTW